MAWTTFDRGGVMATNDLNLGKFSGLDAKMKNENGNEK